MLGYHHIPEIFYTAYVCTCICNWRKWTIKPSLSPIAPSSKGQPRICVLWQGFSVLSTITCGPRQRYNFACCIPWGLLHIMDGQHIFYSNTERVTSNQTVVLKWDRRKYIFTKLIKFKYVLWDYFFSFTVSLNNLKTYCSKLYPILC